MTTLRQARAELKAVANAETARVLQGFFKTGPGQYAEGDRFIGVRVPDLRAIARRARGISTADTTVLLRSPIHEERLLALVILSDAYPRGDARTQAGIFRLYFAQIRYVNNWDLVDGSAPNIVGRHLEQRSRRVLYRLARSRSLWERRIAIVSTQHFIRNADYADTLAIAALLLDDPHDLIHKATGWMLREVGKRDLAPLRGFLTAHPTSMPRTMLRYAIERLSEPERRRWLARAPQ